MASIGDLTATLRANTTDFTAKMDAATASSAKLALALQDPVAQLRQLGIAAGQATGEQRALMVAQQQAIIEGMKAKGLVIVNGQVAYSATAAAEAQTAMAESSVAAGIAGQGLGSNAQRLERSIGSLVTRMVGIPMQVGSIGTSLTRSILGTTGALAAVVAIGLVFAALSSLVDHFRAAAKAGEESAKRITDAWQKVTLKNEFDDVNKAMQQVIDTQRQLEALQANPQHQATVLGASGQAETVTVGNTQAAIDAAVLARNEANQKYLAAQKALNDALMGRPGVKANEKRDDRLQQMQDAGIPTTTPEGQQSLLGASDKDFNAALEAWKKFDSDVASDRVKAFNNRFDAAQQEADREQKLRTFVTQTILQDEWNEGLQRQQVAAQAAQRMVNEMQRQGQRLSDALVSGVVEGNLQQQLFQALKRLFEDVVAQLLEAKIFAKLEKALLDAFGGGQQSSGWGGSVLGIAGSVIGGLATGGLGALAFSSAATGVAGGNALAKSGGAHGTVVVNASGSMPRALSPVEHARDSQWLALIAETGRVLPSMGIRLKVS